MKSILLTSLLALLSLVSTHGQGMPKVNRDTIHELLGAHNKIKREVKVTDDGYTATTTSEDKEVVKALQRHVGHMETRMKKGLMVRRWDPAYAEFVNHYDDIKITIKDIDHGVSVVAKGTTEDAKKVARNHAGIITKLVANGFDEAHKAHAAILSKQDQELTKETTKAACCAAGPKGDGTKKACCKEGKTAVGKKDKACCKESKPSAGKETKACCKKATLEQ